MLLVEAAMLKSYSRVKRARHSPQYLRSLIGVVVWRRCRDLIRFESLHAAVLFSMTFDGNCSKEAYHRGREILLKTVRTGQKHALGLSYTRGRRQAALHSRGRRRASATRWPFSYYILRYWSRGHHRYDSTDIQRWLLPWQPASRRSSPSHTW